MSKTSHTLDLPYPNLAWPSICYEEQAVILNQLCSLLAPVGEHRSTYVTPSKGKQDKKKRRQDTNANGTVSDLTSTLSPSQERDSAAPSPPEITQFLTIGFNTLQRHLETMAQRSSATGTIEQVTLDPPQPRSNSLLAVFVDRSAHSPILYEHLPLLISTASLSAPKATVTRLVSLPKGSSTRLSAALQIPRVSMIGLFKGAPNAQPLINYVMEHVAALETPWVKDVQAGTYLSVAIKAISCTSEGSPKNRASGPGKQPQSKKQKTAK